MQPIIVDSHQDIAWNKVALQRDFLQAVAENARAKEPRRRTERGRLW